MHITKRLFLAAAMAAGFVGSAQAADLDLNGVDRTVTDVAELAGCDGVTRYGALETAPGILVKGKWPYGFQELVLAGEDGK